MRDSSSLGRGKIVLAPHPEWSYNSLFAPDDLWAVPIYRIFSIDRFVELARTRQNVLVSPYKWDDPFENFLLRCPVRDASGRTLRMGNLAERWYGQCWTSTRESDAMWRIYSPEKKLSLAST
jgi:hypothetical protein